MVSYKSKSADIIIGLYESAIEALEGAERAFFSRHRGAAEEFHSHLIRCQGMMHQLIGSLDLRRGGETAAQLFRMYDGIARQTVRANIMKEIQGVREACDLLRQLREKVIKEVGEQEPKLGQWALFCSSN